MQSHGTLDATIRRAREYGARALDSLSVFPDGAERRALAGIVEFCIARAR